MFFLNGPKDGGQTGGVVDVVVRTMLHQPLHHVQMPKRRRVNEGGFPQVVGLIDLHACGLRVRVRVRVRVREGEG